MTTDEELSVLETQLRRLKIEYEVYFSNPTKRPPTDIEWKVLSLLRKFSDGGRMSFSQRFRYNEMAQRYAIYSDLWRKKSRIREEGYRRPQDALLAVQGVRPEVEEHKPQHNPVYGLSHTATAAATAPAPATSQPVTLHSAVDKADREQVERLFNTLVAAKKKACLLYTSRQARLARRLSVPPIATQRQERSHRLDRLVHGRRLLARCGAPGANSRG